MRFMNHVSDPLIMPDAPKQSSSAPEADNPHRTFDGQEEGHVPTFPVPERNLGKDGYPAPFVQGGLDGWKEEWKKSVGDQGDEWWRKAAEDNLYWHRPFTTVRAGGFENGDTQWLCVSLSLFVSPLTFH
jgi:acetyl-CoA synthetase